MKKVTANINAIGKQLDASSASVVSTVSSTKSNHRILFDTALILALLDLGNDTKLTLDEPNKTKDITVGKEINKNRAKRLRKKARQ